MSNESGFGCLIASLLFAVGVAAFSAGHGIATHSLQAELLQRGLQEYDTQTGQLVWTEKAGGRRK